MGCDDTLFPGKISAGLQRGFLFRLLIDHF
jgi:hypothetical protein